MINFLLVGNGTTAFNFHYRPWLPFYNFGLYLCGLIVLALILAWANQDKLAVLSIDLIASSLIGALLNFFISSVLDLTPLGYFGTWLIFTLVIQVWLSPYSMRLIRKGEKETCH